MLVRDFLEETAERTPNKVALVCGQQRLTYAAIDAQADRLASEFARQGVQRGDRVVVHLPNDAAAVVAIFAVLKAGAVFVPVNATAKVEKVGFILRNCRATALVASTKNGRIAESPWLRVVVDCTSGTPARMPTLPHDGIAPNLSPPLQPKHSEIVAFADILAAPEVARPPRVNAPEDLACLIYTSGSTGQPKGVMCEHRNVVFVSGSIIQYLENTSSDIVVNALPLSFDYGLYQLLMTFRFGGTLVLENSFAYPTAVLQRIAQERVTGLPGVPTFFSLLVRQDLTAFDLSSLRYLTNTAAALPPSHILELRNRFPQARLYSMYGLTETKRTLYLPPEELERRPGSVGIPIPGTEAWLENEEDRPVPAGEVGELVVRGPHVMRGYWENPEATACRFRSGSVPGEHLCYSGDLFRQDSQGYFYFVGRKDDIIKSRGEKVAPKEVENVLYALPGIIEAAVVGVPDAVLGQAVKAYVACRETVLSARQVLAHCRAHLEDFMVPREIEFCDALPKNGSGKIDKLALCRSADLQLAAKQNGDMRPLNCPGTRASEPAFHCNDHTNRHASAPGAPHSFIH